MITIDYYKTQNLALAAALQVVSKAKLNHIERVPNSPKATFCFNPNLDSRFSQIVEDFFAQQLSVDASMYFEALRFVKSRLYEETSGSAREYS